MFWYQIYLVLFTFLSCVFIPLSVSCYIIKLAGEVIFVQCLYSSQCSEVLAYAPGCFTCAIWVAPCQPRPTSSCCAAFHYYGCVCYPRDKCFHHYNFVGITMLTSIHLKYIRLLNASSQKGHNTIYTSAEKDDWYYKGIVQLFLISL